MTKDQVVEVSLRYAKTLEEQGSRPFKSPDAQGRQARMEHIHWMCLEIPRLASENVEKAMRWLGFAQGALWALGIHTIEQMKDDNRSPQEPTSA